MRTIITAVAFVALVFGILLLTSCGNAPAPEREIVSEVYPIRVRVLESNTISTVYIPDRELCKYQYSDTIWFNPASRTIDDVTRYTMMAVIDEQVNCNE